MKKKKKHKAAIGERDLGFGVEDGNGEREVGFRISPGRKWVGDLIELSEQRKSMGSAKQREGGRRKRLAAELGTVELD